MVSKENLSSELYSKTNKAVLNILKQGINQEKSEISQLKKKEKKLISEISSENKIIKQGKFKTKNKTIPKKINLLKRNLTSLSNKLKAKQVILNKYKQAYFSISSEVKSKEKELHQQQDKLKLILNQILEEKSKEAERIRNEQKEINNQISTLNNEKEKVLINLKSTLSTLEKDLIKERKETEKKIELERKTIEEYKEKFLNRTTQNNNGEGVSNYFRSLFFKIMPSKRTLPRKIKSNLKKKNTRLLKKQQSLANSLQQRWETDSSRLEKESRDKIKKFSEEISFLEKDIKSVSKQLRDKASEYNQKLREEKNLFNQKEKGWLKGINLLRKKEHLAEKKMSIPKKKVNDLNMQLSDLRQQISVEEQKKREVTQTLLSKDNHLKELNLTIKEKLKRINEGAILYRELVQLRSFISKKLSNIRIKKKVNNFLSTSVKDVNEMKMLLKKIDNLLAKLPKKEIDFFSKSADYLLYKKVLNKYGIK